MKIYTINWTNECAVRIQKKSNEIFWGADELPCAASPLFKQQAHRNRPKLQEITHNLRIAFLQDDHNQLQRGARPQCGDYLFINSHKGLTSLRSR